MLFGENMKVLKIILVNILLFFIGLLACDYILYKVTCNEYAKKSGSEKTKLYPPPAYFDFYKRNYTLTTLQFMREHQNELMFRPTFKDEIKEPKKPSILVFGCSFAYGGRLTEKQTFAYKLQKATNRLAHNYAICAAGIQHMLYIIQHPDFLKRVDDKPEYAIYVYISDHQRRLHVDSHPIETNGLYLRYSLKNDKLELIKEYLPSWFYRTFIVRRYMHNVHDKFFDFQYYYDENKSKQLEYDNFVLANAIFLESKRLLSERYPGIKFVILKYTDYFVVNEYPKMWDTLREEGFIVLDTKDLIGRTFTVEDTVEDKFHPNEQAWDLLVPKVVEKLKL